MTAHRTALSCPRCATLGSAPPPLFAGSASGMILHACGACGGVFLGSKCAELLSRQLPIDALQLASQAADHAKRPVDTAAPLRCPSCHGDMVRTHVQRAGVDVDTCPRHGSWYDRNEMGRIAAAIRSSGWGPPAGAVGAGAAVGAAAAGAIALGAAGPGGAYQEPVMNQVNSTLADVAGGTAEVALEVGAEGILEGVFSLLGALLE